MLEEEEEMTMMIKMKEQNFIHALTPGFGSTENHRRPKNGSLKVVFSFAG